MNPSAAIQPTYEDINECKDEICVYHTHYNPQSRSNITRTKFNEPAPQSQIVASSNIQSEENLIAIHIHGMQLSMHICMHMNACQTTNSFGEPYDTPCSGLTVPHEHAPTLQRAIRAPALGDRRSSTSIIPQNVRMNACTFSHRISRAD